MIGIKLPSRIDNYLPSGYQLSLLSVGMAHRSSLSTWEFVTLLKGILLTRMSPFPLIGSY